MKKFKAMFAATAAVMALSAVSVPMSAFAIDRVNHEGTQTYTFDPGEVVEPGADHKHNTWDAAYGDQVGEPIPSARVNVDFSIAPTYTVTIPADVHFADGQREKDAQVKVENVFLAPGGFVRVTVESDNYYRMVLNGNNDRYYIPYILGKVQDDDGQVPNEQIERIDHLVVNVPTGTQDEKGSETVKLKYKIAEVEVPDPVDPQRTILKPYNVPVAGSYSDILTFTIAVGFDN